MKREPPTFTKEHRTSELAREIHRKYPKLNYKFVRSCLVNIGQFNHACKCCRSNPSAYHFPYELGRNQAQVFAGQLQSALAAKWRVKQSDLLDTLAYFSYFIDYNQMCTYFLIKDSIESGTWKINNTMIAKPAYFKPSRKLESIKKRGKISVGHDVMTLYESNGVFFFRSLLYYDFAYTPFLTGKFRSPCLFSTSSKSALISQMAHSIAEISVEEWNALMKYQRERELKYG